MAARMWRPNWVRTIPGWTAKELILHPHCSECNNYLMQTIVSFVEASSKQYICKLALSICRPEILIECSNTNRRNTKHRSSASASDHQNVFFLLLEPSCQMPCEKSLQDVVDKSGIDIRRNIHDSTRGRLLEQTYQAVCQSEMSWPLLRKTLTRAYPND